MSDYQIISLPYDDNFKLGKNLKYKRDASSMYTLMTWPVYDNVKGKTLELNPWF